MERKEQERVPLSTKQEDEKPIFNQKQPPPISNRMRRPWRGIFLSYFLLFCGLLFFTHGFHKYNEYSVWDLLAVWILSGMLIIPGLYFGIMILMIELRFGNLSYKDHPQLSQ